MNESKILGKVTSLDERIKKYFPNFDDNAFLAIAPNDFRYNNGVCAVVHDKEGYFRGLISFNKDFSPYQIRSNEGVGLGFYMHYPKEDKIFIVGSQGEERGKDLEGNGIEIILERTKQIKIPEYKIR